MPRPLVSAVSFVKLRRQAERTAARAPHRRWRAGARERDRRRVGRRAGAALHANGGSSIAPSPTACKKPGDRLRFAHVRLLEFGDSDYGWSRFLDYVNDRGFDNRGNRPLRRPRFFPRNLLSPWGA